MSDMRSRAQSTLDALVGPSGFLGAALVSRDGLPVICCFGRPVNEDTFSAMVAALLGAAEAAWQEWGEDRPDRAILEGAKMRLVIQGLDPEYLLAVAGSAQTDSAAFLAAVEKAAESLRSVLKG